MTSASMLNENIKALLLSLGKHERVEKGTTLIHEGSFDDDAFYIESGEVKIVRISREGHLTHLATMGSGEIFGHFACLTKNPRSANVLAEEDTELLRISGKDILKALDENSELKNQLMLGMTQDLIQTQNELIDKKSIPTSKRIISMLKENREDDGRILTPRGWKTKQAEVLGIARENFSRYLSDLQKQGVIEVRSGFIDFLPKVS